MRERESRSFEFVVLRGEGGEIEIEIEKIESDHEEDLI